MNQAESTTAPTGGATETTGTYPSVYWSQNCLHNIEYSGMSTDIYCADPDGRCPVHGEPVACLLAPGHWGEHTALCPQDWRQPMVRWASAAREVLA